MSLLLEIKNIEAVFGQFFQSVYGHIVHANTDVVPDVIDIPSRHPVSLSKELLCCAQFVTLVGSKPLISRTTRFTSS